MNIKGFKVLLANLPEDVSNEQFDLITADYEALAEQNRLSVVDELDATLARVAALQAKLGGHSPAPVAASPPVRQPRAQPNGDFTDADLGVGDDDVGMTQGSFLSELATARASGAAKRRRLS